MRLFVFIKYRTNCKREYSTIVSTIVQ